MPSGAVGLWGIAVEPSSDTLWAVESAANQIAVIRP